MEKRNNLNIKVSINLVFIFLWICFNNNSFAKTKNDSISSEKKATVAIRTLNFQSIIHPLDGMYKSSNCDIYGTGVLVDKQKGIILTTDYVTLRANQVNIEITFYNGFQTNAQVLYYDHWCHVAFLKVDPNKIPSEIEEAKISETKLQKNEEVKVISNYDSNGNFIINTSKISDLFYCNNSCQNILIKADNYSSPVFNTKGELISFITYSSNGNSFGIHKQYISYLFSFIKKNTLPKRQHIGAIFVYYFLPFAIKSRNFPEELLEKTYTKFFKKASGRGIQVLSTLKGSPAHGKLKNGDIIWKVNGKFIGPNLWKLDYEMNISKSKINIEVIRNGKSINVEINLYDLEKNKINKFINYDNNIIFKIDDRWSRIVEEPSGSLFILFKNEFNPYKLISVDGVKFYDLKNLYDFLKSNSKKIKVLKVIECGKKRIGNMGEYTFDKFEVKHKFLINELSSIKMNYLN